MVIISPISSDSDESLIFPVDNSTYRYRAGKEKQEKREIDEPDGCCGCTARVCVFIWGVLLLVCGLLKILGGLAAGGWKIDPKTGGGITAIIELCVGIFIIAIAVFAIIGAAIRNRCMLMCVFGFVIGKIVLVVAVCVVCVLLIWDVMKMEDKLKKVEVKVSGEMSPNTARGIATGIVIAVVLVVIAVLAVVAACVKRAAGNKVTVESSAR